MGGRQTKRQRREAGITHAREVYDDRDFGINVLDDGKGRLTVRWRTDREPTLTLMGIERMRNLLDGIEAEWVLALREDGASWEELGWCLGQTGEAVRKRHGAADRQVREANGE